MLNGMLMENAVKRLGGAPSYIFYNSELAQKDRCASQSQRIALNLKGL